MLTVEEEMMLAFIKDVNPIRHEPLLTEVAEAWLDRFKNEYAKEIG